MSCGWRGYDISQVLTGRQRCRQTTIFKQRHCKSILLASQIDKHLHESGFSSATHRFARELLQEVTSAISRQKDEPRQNKPTGAEVTALSVLERTDRRTQCAHHFGTREAGEQRGERVWRLLLRPQAPSVQTYTVFKYTQERGVCVSW